MPYRLWRRCDLQPKTGFSSAIAVIAALALSMGFVRKHDEIGQTSKVVEVGLTDIFLHFTDTALIPIDLVHIENVDDQAVEQI